MFYTRIYADENGHSCFEVVTVTGMRKGMSALLSLPVDTKTLVFCKDIADGDWNFYPAPAKQFIILLDGEIEITTSLGEVRRFCGGDILFVEDVTGHGHKTEAVVQCMRNCILIIV